MTIVIDGYEVEVKAKQTGRKNFNKRDTQVFLNHICANLACAQIYLEDNGDENAEYWAGKLWEHEHAIYQTLNALGFYKERGL